MARKIKFLQAVTIKGQRYEYGHKIDFSVKSVTWLNKRKINYQVTRDEK